MGKAVCFECIDDFYLKKIIKDEGALLECSVCGEESNNAFSVEQLGKLLEPIMRKHFLPGDSIKEFGGDDDEWWRQEGEPMSWAVQIVLDQYLDFVDEIVDAVIEAEGWRHNDASSFWDKTSNYVEKRTEGGHFIYEWESTLEELKHSRRFFSPAAQNLFGRLFDGVEDLKAWNGKSFQPVVRRLPTGTKLFRARICKSKSMLRDIIEDPFKHVGPPPKEHAQAGRMNPEGVNVFYGAREADTCLAETRPALGNDVAIITLEITKSIRVLDFSRLERSRGGKALSYFQQDYEEQVNKRDFLQHVHRLISQHVVPGRESDYLITQTMSEYLAHVYQKPFDGILFNSTQRERGTNVVLFAQANWWSDSLAEAFRLAYVPDSISLFSTTSIKYKYRESDVSYQIPSVQFETDDDIPF